MIRQISEGKCEAKDFSAKNLIVVFKTIYKSRVPQKIRSAN